MLQAGTLNRRVRIERRGEVTDPGGSVVDGWIPVATVWASVRTMSGREFSAGGGTASQATASIRIRYRQGINAGMRVVMDDTDTVYGIAAVLPDEVRREHVDLACTTGANLG